MKAIFLDIDGVICLATERSKELDAGCLRNLKRIVEVTGAVIVLSSTWRLFKEYRKPLDLEFQAAGLKIYDETKDLAEAMAYRQEEIVEYLGRHPEVTRFAVIDDDPDGKVPGQPESFFLTTYEELGLNEKVAERVIAFLNKAG